MKQDRVLSEIFDPDYIWKDTIDDDTTFQLRKAYLMATNPFYICSLYHNSILNRLRNIQ